MIATVKRTALVTVIVIGANVLGYVGCKEAISPHESAHEYCAGEARASFYLHDASANEAMGIYDRCMKAHGQ